VVAEAPNAPSPETVLPAQKDAAEVAPKRAEPEVRERAVEVAKVDLPEREVLRLKLTEQLEVARLEVARLEAERLKAVSLEIARQAAARLEAQRQEAARVEAARLEAQRQEAARVEAARLDAQRQEAARLAAAQLETQRQEAARQASARVEGEREAARLEAQRQAAVQQAAAGQEAARVLAEKEEDAKRAARREAMGRTLNEEAAKRAAAETAARPSSTLPLSYSSARRARLWGRTDPNVELVQYAEAWARKIQFNTPADAVREVAKRPHTNPMVSVAIRSDGSVESVTFAVSSGVPEVDEAIRRIVQSLVPYPAFPPRLAREYDVIEVRRTWHFDTAIRLY
jgi:TonB family protein